ncbi:MAG: molybdopterin molybdenumtransferase MoeA [Caldilineaceae bacterium]|nr:molybdopterin molybdenumtransferase MoeA [Caldilineaceae bacterium]
MAESPYPMLPVADALAVVLEQATPLTPVILTPARALGLTLAEDVRAGEPLPPFPAAVKDGYAVVASDGPGDYPVIGQVTAGRMADFTLEAGSVAYITTGAPVPMGADAVVMVEETVPLPEQNGVGRVRINTTVAPGQDVRPIGLDVQAGQTLLAAGARLGAAEIGLLSTAGATAVRCYPRPRVAILSTGDELVEPDQLPGPGQIRDSNRAMLAAAIRQGGGEVVDLGIGRDDQAQLEASVQRGLREADILLTSGGVSMGDLDLIKPLLDHAGRVHFGRIRMKPGKPLTFATADAGGRRTLIFGLPGNPVSSLVTFYLMALPAMRRLAGHPQPALPQVQAHLAQPLALDPQRPEYHRATLRWDSRLNDGRGGFLAVSTGSQASSRLLSMRSANALLELPQGQGELASGAVVDAFVIGEFESIL